MGAKAVQAGMSACHVGSRAKHSREFWCKHLSHGDTSWDVHGEIVLSSFLAQRGFISEVLTSCLQFHLTLTCFLNLKTLGIQKAQGGGTLLECVCQ